MSLQLIWMFKELFTHRTFGFFLCEVFVHRSRAQKPSVFLLGLFPSTLFLIFYIVIFLLAFPVFSHTFWFGFPPFV